MNNTQSQPWWKFGHVWLVVAGPAVVVVASFVTLYLAITIPDPVVTTDAQRLALEVNRNAPVSGLAPAMQARNHAATGVSADPKR